MTKEEFHSWAKAHTTLSTADCHRDLVRELGKHDPHIAKFLDNILDIWVDMRDYYVKRTEGR